MDPGRGEPDIPTSLVGSPVSSDSGLQHRPVRILYAVRMRAVLWFVVRVILGLLILYLAVYLFGAMLELLSTMVAAIRNWITSTSLD